MTVGTQSNFLWMRSRSRELVVSRKVGADVVRLLGRRGINGVF